MISKTELPRILGLRDATMLVISSVIGVGIFFTPGGVAKLLPNPWWFFGAWVAGGLLALAGALANAELGAMFPNAGGNYVYLRAAYHPAAGFAVGWLSFFAIFAGTVATLAVGVTLSLSSFMELGPVSRPVIAIGVIWIATAVNAYATRAGARLNNVTGYLKVAAIVALVTFGPLFGKATPLEAPFAASGPATLGTFGLALSPVIFSYLGWNASVYVAGEIHEPGRNLPRSLFWGLGICTAIYLLVTVTFVRTIGMQKLAGMPDVGFQVGSALFGPSGAKVVTVLMLASVFGCLNANTLVGPRIAYAMAKDDLFFRGAANLNDSGTPTAAVIVQAAVASVLVLVFGKFSKILDYTTFAIVLATIADTSALYALRKREPNRERPYRAWGYPIIPGLYLLANVAIAITMVRERPFECLMGTVVLLSALPVYWMFASRRPAAG